MKDFFKFMVASMLGFLLVMLIMFFISFGLMMSLAALTEKTEVVIRENTVIRIDLNDPVPERTPKNDFLTALAGGSFKTVLGLNDVRSRSPGGGSLIILDRACSRCDSSSCS